MNITEKYKDYNIVFFDGVCNFCNSTVDKIWVNNTKRDLYYSSLQSGFAKQFLKEHGIDATDLDTVIFYSGQKIYLRSSAILEITKHLGGAYKLLPGFKIIPSFLRDAFYKWFAKNRYKFFGKKETCRIPTAEEKQYFIE
ncbi:MAG TPA: DCC1-like thiol-disulfide oxidoreductase family protein [Bacteroidia bacterium]|jgi:predicted DCC family thiol-disulfide oxidoreductase YuxK